MKERKSSLLIGIHSVESALTRVPGQVITVMVTEGCRNPRVLKLVDVSRELGIEVRMESRALLDSRSEGERHQDVIAEFLANNILSETELEDFLGSLKESPLLLILDGVQDPHNLGACLRTAEAAGVDGVILPKDRSAGLTPVARRSASGAAEVLPVLFATNLARVLRRLKEEGVWLVGTSDQASSSLYQADLKGSMGLVMGSEGKGMRRLTAELCDYQVQIPMKGSVSSLNVSVAAGVCLFEMMRQRTPQ